MNPDPLIPHPCPTCRKSTDHVLRLKRDPSRSHEKPRPVRQVYVCVECATWSETLPSREVRP